MHLNVKFCIPAAMVVLLSAAAAMAAGPGFPRSERYFKQLDADASGKLSLAEITSRTEKRILRMDRDKDGKVTSDEIDAWLNEALLRRRDQMLTDYDADRNGAISREDLSAVLSAEFGKADKDADGGITLEESRSYRYVRSAAEAAPPSEEEDE